jgi:hypothetical protein
VSLRDLHSAILLEAIWCGARWPGKLGRHGVGGCTQECTEGERVAKMGAVYRERWCRSALCYPLQFGEPHEPCWHETHISCRIVFLDRLIIPRAEHIGKKGTAWRMRAVLDRNHLLQVALDVLWEQLQPISGRVLDGRRRRASAKVPLPLGDEFLGPTSTPKPADDPE